MIKYGHYSELYKEKQDLKSCGSGLGNCNNYVELLSLFCVLEVSWWFIKSNFNATLIKF